MATDMNDYFNKKKKESSNPLGGGGMKPPKMPEINFSLGGGKGGIIYFIVGLIIFLVLTKPFVIITEGERGILATNGKYEPNALLPGLHFILPVIQKVYLVDTKVRIVEYAESIDRATITTTSGITTKPAITVLDKRGLPVTIELTVQFRLNAQFAAQTISNWGFTWEDKIINPVVRDIVRNVIGQYDAESLPTARNEIATGIEAGIRTSVEGQKNAPVVLQSVQLREIVLPQKVKDQIERVQIAKQEVQRAEQEVERAKQEALKRAAEAQGVAEAREIEAVGRSKAITIEAEATAKANEVIAQSLTEKLLTLEQIQVQGKFNEALRENKDAKIFLTPGGSTPNIWVDTKDVKKQSSVTE